MKNKNILIKSVWDRFPGFRLLVAMALSMAFWSGNFSLSQAAEVHYDRLLRMEEFGKYDKAVAHRLQQDLATIYHDDPDFLRDVALGHKPLTDDIVGPVTLFWMQRFCYTFKIAPIGDFTGGLIASIADFAAFSIRHPTEKTVILSSDFGHWVDALPSTQKNNYYGVRRAGTDTQRIDMVAEYLKSRQANSPATIKSVDQRTIYTYRLQAEDIQILRGKPNIMKDLATFPSKPFADVTEFDAAIVAALKDVPPDFVKRYLPTIESVAKIDGYRITDASLQRLEDLSVPDDLVDAIKPLQGILYPTEKDLETALEAAVEKTKLQASLKKYQSQIIAAAEIGTYSLDKDALKKLSDKLSGDQKRPFIPIPLINILTYLEDVDYPSTEFFDKAAQAKILESIGACPDNTPDYAKYVRSLILKESDYQALQSAVVESFPDADAKQGADVNKKFEAVSGLRKFAAICTSEQTGQAEALAAGIYNLYKKTITDVARKTPLGKSAPIRWSGGSWGVKNGAVVSSCGCVLNDLSGEVYGFFPFWLEAPKASSAPAAGKEDQKQVDADNTQILDFNVLSRVGFVGFTFDDKGNLTQSIGRNDTSYDFTKVAHNFQTQTDWVIRKDDWAAWMNLSEQEQTSYFNNLIVNILDLLKKTDGNGVTLFFDRYPGNEVGANGDAIILFDQFVDTLSKRLRASGKKYGLNIVLKQPDVVSKDNPDGATERMNSYEHMLKLLGLINPDENGQANWKSGNQIVDWAYSLAVTQPSSKSRNHLLLLIEEPTTSSKKRLRVEIEQALHGEERHRLLSGIIPVIEFDGHNWEQLEDDIIYFKDNFDGIGFWPLQLHKPSQPATSAAAAAGSNHCDHGETVAQCLVKTYQGSNLNGVGDNVVDKFVCQFHMWFRALFCILLAIFLTAYLVPIFTCYMHGWVERNFKLLVANAILMGVVGVLLFAWDPALEGSHAHLIIMAGLAALIGIEAFRRHDDFVARTVKPSRAKEALVNMSVLSKQDERQIVAKNASGNTVQQKRKEDVVDKKVLLSISRLRTYLNGSDEPLGAARLMLQADVNHVDAYLEAEKRERDIKRNKIRKSMRAAINIIGSVDSDSCAGLMLQRKIQRVVRLVWYYLNRNNEQEKQLMDGIKPVLDKLDGDTLLNSEDLKAITGVLVPVQAYLNSQDKSESDTFNRIGIGISMMMDSLDYDGQQQVSAREEIRAAMLVVWEYLDQDRKLHGATPADGT
jgi:hypothetical protein